MPEDTTQTTLQRLVSSCHHSLRLNQLCLRPILQKQQVSSTEYNILLHLQHLPKSTKKALAKRMCLEHASLTRALDRLEARKYLRRKVAAHDKRFILLTLTAKGIKKLESIRNESEQLMLQILSEASSTQLAQIQQAMEYLQLSLLKKLKTEASPSQHLTHKA